MGDVKLAAPVGLYLGYLGWSQLFYGGALGFVLGGIFSVVLIRLKRAELSVRSRLWPLHAGRRTWARFYWHPEDRTFPVKR